MNITFWLFLFGLLLAIGSFIFAAISMIFGGSSKKFVAGMIGMIIGGTISGFTALTGGWNYFQSQILPYIQK